MKILVIGGGGQLGSKLIEQAKDKHEVYATYVTRLPKLDSAKIYKLDKTDYIEVQKVFEKVKPELVVDTAALHNVDYCETHKDEAWKINVEGTRNIAKECRKYNAKLVFISTDFVFDGKKGNYSEEDQPNPINYYGITKLEAEKTVNQTCENHVIVRPSVIYSWISEAQATSISGKPLNFAMWLIQKLLNNEEVNIVTDQYTSPTLADHLAETILKLGEQDKVGVYHVAGKNRLNRYEFSVKLAEKLSLNRDLIKPITSDKLKQIAKRPKDSSLNVSKVEKELGLKMLTIDEALDIFSRKFKVTG